jgi:hypothetical protein
VESILFYDWKTDSLWTDTREKPYLCRCGAAFTRRDLLTRHWRITQHAGSAAVADSTSSSEIAAIDIVQQEHLSHVCDTASNGEHIAGAIESIAQVQRSQLDLDAATAPFQVTQTHLITPGKPLLRYGHRAALPGTNL